MNFGFVISQKNLISLANPNNKIVTLTRFLPVKYVVLTPRMHNLHRQVSHEFAHTIK